MQALSDNFIPLIQELEQVERQIEILSFERQALRKKIADQLQQHQQKQLTMNLGQSQVQLRMNQRTTIVYQEELLLQRLGSRYLSILSPDVQKIRKHEELVLPLLQPVLIQVGKVSRNRVQVGFENGLFKAKEFEGAFQRNTQLILTIKKTAQQRRGSDTDPF